MKLYAVCWQDDCEPWGWEPILPGNYLNDPPGDTFFWDREEAERRLWDLKERLVELHPDWYGRPDDVSELSVQEYEVPEPPR